MKVRVILLLTSALIVSGMALTMAGCMLDFVVEVGVVSIGVARLSLLT